MRTFEARLRPLAIVLFTGSGMLNLLLLAAPWQARRKIALLDAIEHDAIPLDAIERDVVTPRRR